MTREPDVTQELAASHGLKPDEYQRILELLGRTPSFTELGIFSAQNLFGKSGGIETRLKQGNSGWKILLTSWKKGLRSLKQKIVS